MVNATKMVVDLLQDKRVDTAYLTGRAGTGKTTEVIKICQYLYDNQIPFVVCAYTHKACEVLSDKFPHTLQKYICTLHSFLGKRPGVNDLALSTKHVAFNYTGTVATRPHILIIDEFSMVGEKDLMDIRAMQDPPEEDEHAHIVKCLMVGDAYQLPPVGDQQTIVPSKPYWTNLTVLRRTDKADIALAMSNIIDYLEETKQPEALPSTENLSRGNDIVAEYLSSKSSNKKILAWTNKGVQHLNASVMGRAYPQQYDTLFCSSTRQELIFLGEVPPEQVQEIHTPMQVLKMGTKFKTLEYLVKQKYITFMLLEDPETQKTQVVATIFGMNDYLLKEKELSQRAVLANREIAKKVGAKGVLSWCQANPVSALARNRKKAWREYIAFKDSLMQVDFNHALTVHKSQGSTYEEVYIDMDDLYKCAEMDFKLYLRLLYVGISRAAKRVITT